MIRPSDVFIPIKSILAVCWFVILCIMAPTLAVVLLLVGTVWVLYDHYKGDSAGDKTKARRNMNARTASKQPGSPKRPEYPG